MNDCLEIQTGACKVYITDCYDRLITSYNDCIFNERPILKKNIFDMLDKVKLLIDNKKLENENDTVEKTD